MGEPTSPEARARHARQERALRAVFALRASARGTEQRFPRRPSPSSAEATRRAIARMPREIS